LCRRAPEFRGALSEAAAYAAVECAYKPDPPAGAVPLWIVAKRRP
jgi:hypothetical protein